MTRYYQPSTNFSKNMHCLNFLLWKAVLFPGTVWSTGLDTFQETLPFIWLELPQRPYALICISNQTFHIFLNWNGHFGWPLLYIQILFETETSERTNTQSAFWCVIAEWFVLCKSWKETSSNKQYLSTSRTVKYWRGELTNQLREYKYRHIKPIFRSDYSHHAFLNNPFSDFFPLKILKFFRSLKEKTGKV